ncbi:MAG: hypothetical protein HRT86_01960 [Ilumatobacteraceae bacterium]|nr:hypothetical protein [Ilumatobacteraceae bacterium]
MTGKRIGAAILAVALVGSAWLLRSNVLDDGGDTGDPDAAGPAQVISCVEESAAACRAAGAAAGIDVHIENADTTFDRWATAPADELADTAWITLAPLPDVAAASRVATELPQTLPAPRTQ